MWCLTFITIIVSEKIQILKFSTSADIWPTKNVLNSSLEYTSHTNHIVHALFHVCSNYTTFKLRGQESKVICIWYFWQNYDLEARSRSSNLEWQSRPEQDYNQAQFEKDLALLVSEKKPMLPGGGGVQTQKCINYLPWTGAQIKKSGLFIIYSHSRQLS